MRSDISYFIECADNLAATIYNCPTRKILSSIEKRGHTRRGDLFDLDDIKQAAAGLARMSTHLNNNGANIDRHRVYQIFGSLLNTISAGTEVEGDYLVHMTENIVIEFDRHRIDFGPFRISLPVAATRLSDITVEALEPHENAPSLGNAHPHQDGMTLCFGQASKTVENLLAAHEYGPMFEYINRLLCTYNEKSPITLISTYIYGYEGDCENCGEPIDSQNRPIETESGLLGCEQCTTYVETRDANFFNGDTVFCEMRREYIHEDDAVEMVRSGGSAVTIHVYEEDVDMAADRGFVPIKDHIPWALDFYFPAEKLLDRYTLRELQPVLSDAIYDDLVEVEREQQQANQL